MCNISEIIIVKNCVHARKHSLVCNPNFVKYLTVYIKLLSYIPDTETFCEKLENEWAQDFHWRYPNNKHKLPN